MTVGRPIPKVITLTNHNRGKQHDEPIRISKQLSVTYSKCAKNPLYKVQLLILALLLIDFKTGARFLSQSLSAAMAIT